MKKAFLVFFSLFSLCLFSQKISEFEFVMVPTKFDFQDSDNEYRLNTLLKYRLEEYGFNALYTSDQLNVNYSDRCLFLNANVINESNMFVTKIYIVFKDCNNAIVFQSDIGSSRIKLRKDGYREALENALKSVKALNYQFSGVKVNQVATLSNEETTPLLAENAVAASEAMLFAQAIPNGFQLVDLAPKVILKLLKTSKVDYFIATSDDKNGVVFKNNNVWYFEYYSNEKLISEVLSIKF
jgi:hypothetical protein